MNFLSKIDWFLDKEYISSPLDLSIYRMLLCTVLFCEMPVEKWLYDAPDFMFSPTLSPVIWLTAFPPGFVFTAIHCLMVLSAVCLFLGIKPRAAGISLFTTLLILRAFAYSTGKINHDDILILVILILFTFSHWNQYSWSKSAQGAQTPPTGSDGFPLAMLAFVIAFWMATAGWQKITTDWLNWDYSVVYRYVFNHHEINGYDSEFVVWSLREFPTWLWELGDWATIVFELSGLALFWKRRLLSWWLAAACWFHLGVHVLMSIEFGAAISAYAIFVPWSRLGLAPIVKPSLPVLLWTIPGLVALWLLPFSIISTGVVWLAPIIPIILILKRDQAQP